ncbi:hypothetical protein MQE36_15375 [Zhouia spongiae]|uniref:Secreted protein n=1 Tax=Zhouia spongiae TaxID=2202721 RepID=A0ABY3YMQ8_9FLAO|nr:hypothetical protein [Zhouia spongiae]UNY98448.1 hypothetical protein MQE36_15375 [Zhouia spongiae]
MKKIFLLIILIASNATLFSCTDETLAETEQLYRQQANGEDGDPTGDPDEPEPDPNDAG